MIEHIEKKECKECKETKSLEEFRKASKNIDGRTGKCKVCINAKDRERYQKNPETKLEYQKQFRLENKESIATYKAQHYQANKESIDLRNKQWNEDNKESVAEYQKQYREDNKAAIAEQNKRWRLENRDKCNAISSKYRAAKIQAIPSWFSWWDDFIITESYAQAIYLEEQTGIKHHVDHIVPLQGKLVSGLHCAANVQVITVTENLSKSNKWEP
jgi:hypothetical protein